MARHLRRAAAEREPRYFSSQISQARRFFLGLSRSAGRGFAVVSGGLEYCRPDYLIDREGFPCPVVELVVRGAGGLEMGGRLYDLAPGMAFLYGPKVPH